MWWWYENHKRGRDATIHIAECSHCNHGQGRGSTTPYQRRRWIGPYGTAHKARAEATAMGRIEIQTCSESVKLTDRSGSDSLPSIDP
jgi:hypothetical protein